MRFLVCGAEGQLGRALVTLLGSEVAWSGGRQALDVADGAAVADLVAEIKPDVVINASAYNKVDAAEGEPAQALTVNAAGPAHLARAARTAGALLVHVSTDYVFDGEATRPYVEEDVARPIGAYGASKLAGEHMVAARGGAHLVVRTSAVFGSGGSRAKGGSFLERILARARSGEPLRVVSDQVMSPTYAPHLALALVALVRSGARGLVHVSGSGSCTWHELAQFALRERGLDVPVEAIRAQDLGAAARRPRYSVLSNARYLGLGLPALPEWPAAVRQHLAEIG